MRLSIIIPCYNSVETLSDAVNSCFRQGLMLDDFEILLVDDQSTDGTVYKIAEFVKSFENIHAIFRSENGGGAIARNDGVNGSRGKSLICLDSDDIFPDAMLCQMVDKVEQENLDGVLFSETIFFSKKKNDGSIIFSETVKNRGEKELIAFEDLFKSDNGFLTQVNFLFTRDLFRRVGGYDAGNPFDTQSFGISVLASDARIKICDGTYYFHRRGIASQPSYYEREYRDGMLSVNALLALEKCLDKIPNQIISQIIGFDIFNKNQGGNDDNLWDFVSKKISKKEFLGIKFQDANLTQNYRQCIKALQQGDSRLALGEMRALIAATNAFTPVLLFLMLRIIAMDIKAQVAGHSGKNGLSMALLSLKTLGLVRPVNRGVGVRVKRRFIRFTQDMLSKITYRIDSSLLGKIARHTFSVYIEYLNRNLGDISKFEEIYRSALQFYAKDLNKLDVSKYVTPTWDGYIRRVEDYLFNGFNVNFLRHSIIKSSMFAHLSRSATNQQLSLIRKYFFGLDLKDLLIEEKIGRPILNNLEYRTSGNTIHHLSHLASFGISTGYDLRSSKEVIEWGGGYGNMCRLFKKINPAVTYTIIDLPIFTTIQKIYLSVIFGEDAINMCFGDFNIVPGKINLVPLENNSIQRIRSSQNSPDIFISTWALSESNAASQELVMESSFFEAKNILMGFQAASAEFPLASSVVNLPQSFSISYCSEIDYMPGNYYIFANNSE